MSPGRAAHSAALDGAEEEVEEEEVDKMTGQLIPRSRCLSFFFFSHLMCVYDELNCALLGYRPENTGLTLAERCDTAPSTFHLKLSVVSVVSFPVMPL